MHPPFPLTIDPDPDPNPNPNPIPNPGQVLGETLIEPDDENEELSFSVVDMNNALSSNAFWADAKEVPGWQRLFAAM